MNLLITGAWNASDEQLDKIRSMGHEVMWLQQEWDELPIPYEAVEGVICNGLFLHHPIERFTSLRYIQLTSAGFDRVPMEYVRAKGIRIFNARGVYSVPMAEFVLSSVLQIYKQSRFFAQNQACGLWEKHRGLMELAGKRICILGCGSVGISCAKRFSAFDCRVTGIDLAARDEVFFEKVLSLDDLDGVLPEADVVILTLPLTEQTKHMMDQKRFALLKPGVIFVNVSRGAVVETEALLRWLKSGTGSAVLDVFEEEPLKEDSPLWYMPNVVVTPHNSFVGDGNKQRLQHVILENLERYG